MRQMNAHFTCIGDNTPEIHVGKNSNATHKRLA